MLCHICDQVCAVLIRPRPRRAVKYGVVQLPPRPDLGKAAGEDLCEVFLITSAAIYPKRENSVTEEGVNG
jgi:hypothetical protein